MNPAQLQRHIAKLESRLEDLKTEARIVEGELLLYRAELHLRTAVVSTTVSTQMEAPTAKPPAQVHHNVAGRKSHEAKAAIAKGRNRHGAHVFVAAVLADPRFGSVTFWAAHHCKTCRSHVGKHAGQGHKFEPVPLATVASWYATGGDVVMRKSGRRPVPRGWADHIEEEFTDRKSGKSLVPATEETWLNGISE